MEELVLAATHQKKMSEDTPPQHDGPAREGEEEGEKMHQSALPSAISEIDVCGDWRQLYMLWHKK
eukprot:scaffold34928_cov54-Attheya_sp.AAC.8